MWNLRALRRLRDDTSGNTLAICAAAMLPLTAVIGSALDMSVAYMTRAKLQNACDAGVLAGRQFMQGTNFNDAVEDEAHKFFDFNFPEGTSGTTGVEFTVDQDEDNESQLIGVAEAVVPTSLMRIFGYEEIPLEVSCDATRDMGHNDIVLVLDVTGSMTGRVPGGGTRIERLRTGAMGLYRALDDSDGSVTRYGIVPYSVGVNVGLSLMNKDILREQPYLECSWRGCETTWIHINESSWNKGKGGGDVGGNTLRFREEGGCIEERPSVGNTLNPFRIEDTVTRADIDTRAGNAGNQPELQFGRYDPGVQQGFSGKAVCPAAASTLQPYESERDFRNAINSATSVVDGNTYHDIGMLWGTRFISRTGFFAANNPTEIDGIPVNEHIVFMTDGEIVVNGGGYTAYGVQNRQQRVQGWGTLESRHISRFLSTCDVARSMGITVWVIAIDEELDQDDIDVIEPCATTPDLFFRTDGSDLEEIFEEIGQGIGNLRLTR